MDPDKTLDEIRKILQDGGIEDFGELADLIDALDEWMCRGGFLPEDWTRYRETHPSDTLYSYAIDGDDDISDMSEESMRWAFLQRGEEGCQWVS